MSIPAFDVELYLHKAIIGGNWVKSTGELSILFFATSYECIIIWKIKVKHKPRYLHICSCIVLRKSIILSKYPLKYHSYILYCSFVLVLPSQVHMHLSTREIPLRQTYPRCSFCFHFICLVFPKCQFFLHSPFIKVYCPLTFQPLFI